MDKTLYVFESASLSDFKTAFPEHVFTSIGMILNLASNIDDINNLEEAYMNNLIVDITAFVLDTGYYKLFIERYLYTLIEHFDNVEFSVNYLNKEKFISSFPYMFECINEDYSVKSNKNDFTENSDIPIDDKYIDPIPLLLYTESLLDGAMDKYKIVSIGSFFTGTDNLNYKFDLDCIKDILVSEEIQYIDITQMIDTFALRKDLVLTFEVVLRQIHFKKSDIKFLINEEKVKDIKKYLPFTFNIDNGFFDIIDDSEKDETKKNKLANFSVKEITTKLDDQLKGHEDFKSDFYFNLQKFMLLNELKERKAFSIFLTGESGIGKTEFAKIISNIMYPDQMLIKINFGNYSNEGVLNSLIGSPLGYIGSEDGGELINKMNLSKSKVVLIDEFEKATPSVFHFFYELLEDGKFTDRHGIEHNMDGYIIIFTSNMTRKRYIENIPDSLKSRFDMVYCFAELSYEEKIKFIMNVASKLIDKIQQCTEIQLDINCISLELEQLVKYNNLRGIKRKVEDIAVTEYYKIKGNK